MRSGEAEPAVSASAVTRAGVGAQCGRPARSRPAARSAVAALAEGDRSAGSSPAGSGARSASTSGAYASRRAAHRLGGVVDEDVERALRGDGVGERDDLGGVAQVDADDAQPVDPVGAVLHRLEAADRVVGEARGDRRVGAVAQQPQRDVHADLRAAAGEQRAAAGEVGAGVAALRGFAPRRSGRAGGRRRRPRGSAACRRSRRSTRAGGRRSRRCSPWAGGRVLGVLTGSLLAAG